MFFKNLLTKVMHISVIFFHAYSLTKCVFALVVHKTILIGNCGFLIKLSYDMEILKLFCFVLSLKVKVNYLIAL